VGSSSLLRTAAAACDPNSRISCYFLCLRVTLCVSRIHCLRTTTTHARRVAVVQTRKAAASRTPCWSAHMQLLPLSVGPDTSCSCMMKCFSTWQKLYYAMMRPGRLMQLLAPPPKPRGTVRVVAEAFVAAVALIAGHTIVRSQAEIPLPPSARTHCHSTQRYIPGPTRQCAPSGKLKTVACTAALLT
jgi:hypothetical protein